MRLHLLIPEINFNSLPHAEVDNVLSGISMMMTYFNSLPHAEVDRLKVWQYLLLHHFNSLPHAEVDMYPWSTVRQPLEFQLTTSRRGRLSGNQLKHQWAYFNSLPHAEVDALTAETCEINIAFQLTTSRRGRPLYSYLYYS